MGKQTRQRRCGASLPDTNGGEGWHYCYYRGGHTGYHEDEAVSWAEGKVVEVVSMDLVRSVPDHQHDFVGDQDTCTEHPGCPLTWGEYKAQQEKEAEESSCTFCGHPEERHTRQTRDEGNWDYCTECLPDDEYHVLHGRPQNPQERLKGKLREMMPSSVSEEVLDRAVAVLAPLVSVGTGSPEDLCACGHPRSQHRKAVGAWGTSWCEMCGAMNGNTHYHWRHGFGMED